MLTQHSAVLFFSITLQLTGSAFGQTTYPYAINTIAGMGALGDGGPATAALLEFPRAGVADSSGNIYIGDSGNGSIRVVNSAGIINTLTYEIATSMKIDSAGNIYAADGISQVYKMTPSGTVTILAGSEPGYGGDNGPATAALLNGPNGVAVDASGDVFVADTFNNVIREITPDGKIHTVAGTTIPGYGRSGVSATTSALAYPYGVEVDSSGNLYISEEYFIRRVTAGNITTIAGGGVSPVDGSALNTAIGPIVALAVDKSGNLYLADAAYNMIREITPSGTISTLAGSQTAGFAGDGNFGTKALFNDPIAISLDAQGNIYIADESNQRIRKLNTGGIVNTVAGASHYSGDGGPATSALLHRPEQAIVDSSGDIYISDSDNNAIRKVNTKGAISTIAGNGNCGYSGDFAQAATATLCEPQGIAFDVTGNLYIADWLNCTVRRIVATGIINTIAGNGTCADTAASGNPADVSFEGPFGLAFDSNGLLYISDDVTNRVSVVNLSAKPPTITLFAGTGQPGSSGTGGLSSSAQLNSPGHIAAGPDGAIYIADSGNNRVVKVVPAGVGQPGILTVVNFGNKFDSLAGPDGIVVDSANNLYVTWEGSDEITMTTPTGLTTIIAGTGVDGFSGDDGLAPNARFSGPAGLSEDSAGNFYLADLFNSRIRKLTPDNLTGMTIARGNGQSGNTGTTLPGPLIVTLTFAGGVGIPGTPVTFAVTSGSATLSLSVTTTDANGDAGVAVTLGNTPGPVTVTASTAGVPSVQFNLTAISSVPLPTIATGGIIGAGGSTPPITMLSPGGFATIFGVNFAPTGTFAQAPSGNWPTQLAGTCAMVNGTPAYVTFVSPSQINFQAPTIPVNASVNVQVVSDCGSAGSLESAAQSIATAAATPEFLYWIKNANGSDPAIAVDAITNAYIGAPGLIQGAIFTPAKPGEILTIYGVSFGPTNPAAVPGTVPSGAAQSVYTATVTLGATTLDPSAVLYAGVSPGAAGLYQLNIQIPSPLADGDYALILTLGTFATPAGGFITVKN